MSYSILKDERRIRNRIMRELDIGYARLVMPEVENLSDDVLLAGLHKIRYEATDMPTELREESRAWLIANMYDRLNGEPWPPTGELPGVLKA